VGTVYIITFMYF